MQLVALAPNGHPYRIGLFRGIYADDLEAVDPGIEITATLREPADLEMTRLHFDRRLELKRTFLTRHTRTSNFIPAGRLPVALTIG